MNAYERVEAERAKHPGESTAALSKRLGLGQARYYYWKKRTKKAGSKAKRAANYERLVTAEPLAEKQMIMVMGSPSQLRDMLKEALQ